MVADASDPRGPMLEALAATRAAIHHYAEACRALQRLPHPSSASAQMSLNVRRLEAMEQDLHRRARPQATADALYAGLTVVHAGLLSLADASGRLGQAYRQSMAVPPPAEGWFLEESDTAAAVEPRRASETGQQVDET